MAKKDYLETFLIPGIDVLYPVYVLNEKGRVTNFKAMVYPNPRSKKRYTRAKQLSSRSTQAKIFDAIVNIGFFEPLTVITEFPVVIQNSLRLEGQRGLFFLLDYYFPELRLAVELDSDLHNRENDKIRDRYLGNLGMAVWRIEGLHKPSVQKKEFRALTKWMRENGTKPLIPFDFQRDIREWVQRTSRNP